MHQQSIWFNYYHGDIKVEMQQRIKIVILSHVDNCDSYK